MQGTAGDPEMGTRSEEATSSSLIHDLARLLGCDPTPPQALTVLKAIAAAIGKLLPRLPPAFLEPILPHSSLNKQQVLFPFWPADAVTACSACTINLQRHVRYDGKYLSKADGQVSVAICVLHL